MARQKDVLTTGEVARICNVAPRTVSKWFDSGQLHGYRIPGSKDRRIPLPSLLRFMKHHHIPMDGVVSGRTRVLIVDNEPEVTDLLHRSLSEQSNYEVRVVNTGFAAGLECQRFKPHVMLLDVHLPDIDAQELRRSIRDQEDLQITKVIGMSSRLTDGQAQHLRSTGFDGFLRKPFNLRQVIESIEDAVAMVY